LGQRRRPGRGDAAGRRVREALEREGRPLQVAAPGVVGEAAAGQPVLPVVRGPDLLVVGLLVRPHRYGPAPGEADEPGVALLEQGAGAGLAALEAELHV